MVLRSIPILLVVLFASSMLLGQIRCLRGIVIDKEDKEPLPFATVQVFQDGAFVQGAATDLDGRFSICKLPDSGEVDLQIDYTGYLSLKLVGVLVGIDSIVCEMHTGVLLVPDSWTGGCITRPLVDPFVMTSGQTFTASQIRREPNPSSNYEAIKRRQAKRKVRQEKRRQRKIVRGTGDSR